MQTEHRRQRQSATALDTALRATAVDELDERIGETAVTEYEETVTNAALGASETILEWWRAQSPEVVEAFLDKLREQESTALLHLEDPGPPRRDRRLEVGGPPVTARSSVSSSTASGG